MLAPWQNGLTAKSHYVPVKDLAILINAKFKNKKDFIYKYAGYIKGKMMVVKIFGTDMFLDTMIELMTKNKIKQYWNTFLDLIAKQGFLNSLQNFFTPATYPLTISTPVIL